MPGPPLNLTVNSQQSHIILHWEYTDKDNYNDMSNFSVYCNNMTVGSQPHIKFKTELNILTKNNNATLIGLLVNTVYTCCVSAVFPYMETDSTCINVTKGQLCDYYQIKNVSLFAGFQEASFSTSSTLSSTLAGNLKNNGLISGV